jgi:hypothetical protein
LKGGGLLDQEKTTPGPSLARRGARSGTIFMEQALPYLKSISGSFS